MSELKLKDRHLALRGTVGTFLGAEAILEYEDGWESEYGAVRVAIGVAERTDLDIIRLWGKDPVRMLNGLVTNDILDAGPDRAVYASMLTPKGRTITDLRAIVRPGAGAASPDVLLVLPHAALDAVTGHLRKYLPPHFARWEVRTDLTILGLYGRKAAKITGTLLGTAPDPTEDAVTDGHYRERPVLALATHFAGGEDGFDVLVEDDVAPTAWSESVDQALALSGRPLGMNALEVLRVEAGRARFGIDMTEDTIPAEAFLSTGQMERAVSFTKGCYTGQEVVVRIAHRGHVNRHLRGLVLSDGTEVESGAPVMRPDDGKEVGRVTSTVASPLARAPIALAYLRREIKPGALVSVNGCEGRVVDLPFEEGIRFELPE